MTPHYKAAVASATKLQKLMLAGGAIGPQQVEAQIAEWRAFARLGQASQRTFHPCSQKVNTLQQLAVGIGGRCTELIAGLEAVRAGVLPRTTWIKFATRLSAEILSRVERFNRLLRSMRP